MYIYSYVTYYKLVKNLNLWFVYLFIVPFYKTMAATKVIFFTTVLKSHSHTFKFCIKNGLKTHKNQ